MGVFPAYHCILPTPWQPAALLQRGAVAAITSEGVRKVLADMLGATWGVVRTRRFLHSAASRARPLFHVLGIETSCDDTGVAIVSSDGTVRAQVVVGQKSVHEAYGGVHPSKAGESHVRNLPGAIETVVRQSGLVLGDLAAVAVTRGPGMAPCLLAGVQAGKALALAQGKRLLGIHHMAAHALTARLTSPEVEFPYLCLLTSGGHTLLLEVQGPTSFVRLGTTLDESVGNAIDHVSKRLRIPWGAFSGPGAALENCALKGDPNRVQLPRPMQHAKNRDGYDFSFVGLRSHMDRYLSATPPVTEQDVADAAASFQRAAFDHVLARLVKVVRDRPKDHYRTLVVSGGVACNTYFRDRYLEGDKGKKRLNNMFLQGAGPRPSPFRLPASPTMLRQRCDDRMGWDRAPPCRP